MTSTYMNENVNCIVIVEKMINSIEFFTQMHN